MYSELPWEELISSAELFIHAVLIYARAVGLAKVGPIRKWLSVQHASQTYVGVVLRDPCRLAVDPSNPLIIKASCAPKWDHIEN